MRPQDYLQSILFGPTLSDKLLDIPDFTSWDPAWGRGDFALPSHPGREKKLEFSTKAMRFPKRPDLKRPEKRAMALHFFANHELLAIEMGAAALLLYPHTTDDEILFKQGLLSTLRDEQKHLGLYVRRMEELGVEFGDFPLNSFFWEKMPALKTPAQYLAVMALTFESANIDFARFYGSLFAHLEDHESARIMEIIYQDEIFHVSHGRKCLNHWKGDASLWEYYQSQLPFPLTPARAKGIGLDEEGRRKAGLDEHFLENLKNYRDPFRVTNRRSWDLGS